MVAKESDKLHEPGRRLIYKDGYLIKNKKIELIILQVKYPVSDKSKANHGANEKRTVRLLTQRKATQYWLSFF